MKKSSLVLHLSLFISVLILGAYLRFEHLGKQSLWMDEGYTINAIISGMQNGTRNFASILDSGKTYFCPMYCGPSRWVLGIGHWVSNETTPFRIPAAIFGILFILISYWITKLFFRDKWIALLAMLFTAFSYIQITWSRQARWYTELEVFFWLALGCFYGFLKSSALLSKLPSLILREGPGLGPDKQRTSEVRQVIISAFWFLASLLFTILAILTHPIAYALLLIMFVWFVIEKHPSIKQLFVAIASIAVLVGFTEYGLGLHSLSTNLASHFSLHQNLFYYASFYWRNYWILIILSVIGFIFAGQKQRKTMEMLAIPFFVYFIGLSFFTEAVEYRYLFHTTIAFYTLGAMGMVTPFESRTSSGPNPGPSHTYPLAPSLTHSQTRAKGGGRSLLSRAISTFLSKLPSPLGEGLRAGIIFISFLLLFFTQHLILAPQPFYWLEADDPAKLGIRNYYAYTPQPDWNQAYSAIRDQLQPGDLVISSHPQFNKIFLNQAGYWLAHDYAGTKKPVERSMTHEPYANAIVIHDQEELRSLMQQHHGFIVFDLQSTINRIDESVLNEIRSKGTLFFERETNNYSIIWVYRF